VRGGDPNGKLTQLTAAVRQGAAGLVPAGRRHWLYDGQHLSALALYQGELTNSMGTQMYVLMCVACPVIGLVTGAVGAAGMRPSQSAPLYLELDD
jgi:hypothetical protein